MSTNASSRSSAAESGQDREPEPQTGAGGESGGDPAPAPARDPAGSAGSTSSWASKGIFLLLLVAGLAYARAFLTPVLLAFLLALMCSPVRRAIRRTGLSDGGAAAVVVGGLVAMLLTVGYLLAAPVAGWMADAPRIGEQLEERVREIRTALSGSVDGEEMQAIVEDVKDAAAPVAESERTVVVADAGLPESLFQLVPAIAIQTAFVLVLLLFLLASGDMFYEKIVHVTPRFRDKRRAVRTVHDIERRLSRYLLTISVINAGLGVAIGLAMWVLGMPDPFLFGVIGWLFNYVPYVGAIAGSLLAFTVGMLTFDVLWIALLPGFVYYGLTAIEGQFVTPYFVGRMLKLNTVVVFLTIAFWAWLWSVVGMLIAVPVLVAVRTVCRAVPSLESVADFLSARGIEQEGEPSPDEEGQGAETSANESLR